MSTENAKQIWDFMKSKGMTDAGVAGLMGNIKAESGLIPNNLQNTSNTSLGMTDAEYTTAVDNGTYSNFAKDSAGYGLAQWTWWTRKENLLNYAKSTSASIGNLEMQLAFLWDELCSGYAQVQAVLCSATTVREASDSVLLDFEKPKLQGETVQLARASVGQKYFDEFATEEKEEEMSYDTFKEMMAQYEQEQSALPESTWAKNNKVAEKAKKLGITTDAARPRSAATREEVEQMIISYDEKKGSA